jgi:cytochrome c oxidase subunit II
MNQSVRTKLAAAAALAFAMLAPAVQAEGAQSSGGWGGLNMPVGVTELSKQIYDLHMLIFWVCVIIGVIVFGVMAYSIFAFRRSQGAVPDTTMVHSTKAEIVWTVIPVLILVVMAVPATRTLIAIEDTRNTEISIKVTGYQWKWQYEYLDDGINFFSTLDSQSNEARQLQSGIDPNSVPDYLLNVDNPLVVPEDTKVRLLLTAQDVIHAWWVPDFGMKKDAIPGFVNELWFKVDAGKAGTYRGQCAEICGRDHGFMPIVVKVLSKPDYAAWLAAQKAAAEPATEAAPADAVPTDAADAEVPAQANAAVAPTPRG